MPMFQKNCLGWVRFTGGTGAVLQKRGVVSVVRNGAGDYQIVFDQAADATESMVEAYAEGAAGKLTSYVHTSDTSKQVLMKDDAGAASDPTTVMVSLYQVGFGDGL